MRPPEYPAPSRRSFVGGGILLTGAAAFGSQFVGGSPASASPAAPLRAASAAALAPNPAQQTEFTIHLNGVSAVQFAWWFQHLADDDGKNWKKLAPGINKSMQWMVNPREDAHQVIGSVFASEQAAPGVGLPHDKLNLLVYFADYITQNRSAAGQPAALNPTLAFPTDYTAPYPSPLPGQPVTTAANGFNQDMILLDGKGFAPGRILWSWRNTGGDDTAAASGAAAIDLTVTIYQPWMEGANRPPAMAADGYYYTTAQVQALWQAWKTTLEGLPAQLPKWFGTDTQDDIARTKGYTTTSVIDTGEVDGVDSKMWVWWWNHAMGDEPGYRYTFWCPPAHYTIRWLPGFSPAEVLGPHKKVPTDRVVYGTIYPDLQGGSLQQNGGGMMSYPPSMSPVPGRYKTLNPMQPVSKAQVDNFASDRYPVPSRWLLHQWEDTKNGVIHRSTSLATLPLASPVTQQGFYSEHQLLEGQNWGTQSMQKVYRNWLRSNQH